MNFRDFVKQGSPIYFCFGTPVGERAAAYFVLSAKICKRAAEAINVNEPVQLEYILAVQTDLHPKIIALDSRSLIAMNAYQAKVGLLLDKPYASIMAVVGAAHREDYTRLFSGICRSLVTFASSEEIRQDIQFRHSQFIPVFRDFPCEISSYESERETEIAIIVGNQFNPADLLNVVEHLSQYSCTIYAPAQVGGLNFGLNANVEVRTLLEVAFSEIHAIAAVFIGASHENYPPFRVVDLMLRGIPVAVMEAKSSDSQLLPAHCVGHFPLITGKTKSFDDLKGYIDTIVTDSRFKNTVVGIQRKETSEMKESLAKWLQLLVQ